jgi:hypothetical protein
MQKLLGGAKAKQHLVMVPREDVAAVRELLKSRRAQRQRVAEDLRYREKVQRNCGGDECVWGEPGRFCRNPTDPDVSPQLYCAEHWRYCLD